MWPGLKLATSPRHSCTVWRVPVFSRASDELTAFIYRSGASMEDDGSGLAGRSRWAADRPQIDHHEKGTADD
jgi:hypothetical protein